MELAKEEASFIGIRMDKSRNVQARREADSRLQTKTGMT